MPRNPEAESDQERTQHAWCLQLLHSQAFGFYQNELGKLAKVAHREVCAESPQGSREFHAGRLSALTNALTLIDNRYATLKDKVEVLPQ